MQYILYNHISKIDFMDTFYKHLKVAQTENFGQVEF